MLLKSTPTAISISFLILLSIIISPLVPCYAASLTQKNILIIHAYNQDLPVHEAYNKGLKKKFQQQSQYEINYSYEYLDLVRFEKNADYLADTAHYFQLKYANLLPDMIVTSKSLAPFLLKYGKEIFPGIPVLVVEEEDNMSLELPPTDCVVIPGGLDAQEIVERNIQLILQTRPLTKKIHIVVGQSAEERRIVEAIAPLTDKYANQVELVYLNKMPYEAMLEHIRNVSDSSAILFLRWLVDVKGNKFVPAQVFTTICREAKVPVFSSTAHLFGSGTIGGYVYNFEISGQKTAEVGLAVLNGIRPFDISVPDIAATEYVFDWRELRRWGINEDILPPGSRVEYKETVWERYKDYLIGGIALLLAETILVFGLLINRRKLKQALTLIETMAERLKEQDKRKDIFLTSTSHEFKTPLHGIINITQSVLEDAAGRITPQQTENLSLVVIMARRLSNLVNDILDFEKIKNNEINLCITAVDVRSVTDIVFEVCRYIVKSGRINLVNRIPYGLPPVQADEDRLRQALYNLIGNAAKFTVSGEVAVTAAIKENMLYISVIDTGIGIPPEKHEDIFLSFEQVSASRASAYGGTGLGLTITRQLVEKMRGSIWVAWSEPDKGTVITFTLPVDLPDNASSAQTAALAETSAEIVPLPTETEQQAVKAGEFTVLAVDDEPTNLRVMINVFAKENYNVLTAVSGDEALRVITENRKIDIVLLDVMMPGMTGYEVCRRLREDYSLFELPVLLVTVRSLPEDVAAGFAAGANDFITKPFDASEIRARVSTLLALKKAVGETVRAEVAFLQSQIKPHFFYNVLNTIMSFCYTDSIKAGKLLAEFSSYLRRSFDIQDSALFTSLKMNWSW